MWWFPVKRETPVAVLGASRASGPRTALHRWVFRPLRRFSVREAERSKVKANSAFYPSGQCDEAAFKHEVTGRICLACSFSHRGLFTCPPLPARLLLQAKGRRVRSSDNWRNSFSLVSTNVWKTQVKILPLDGKTLIKRTAEESRLLLYLVKNQHPKPGDITARTGDSLEELIGKLVVWCLLLSTC